MFKTHRGSVSAAELIETFGGSADLKSEELLLGGFAGKGVTLFYLDGLVDPQAISETVAKPMTDPARFPKELMPAAALELAYAALQVAEVRLENVDLPRHPLHLRIRLLAHEVVAALRERDRRDRDQCRSGCDFQSCAHFIHAFPFLVVRK